MKNKYLLLILVLAATYSHAQIKFEKGYLIDNENHRIDCLIKNQDWKNNPSEFEYKLSANDSIQNGNTFNVTEFGIIGFSKFVRADTKIDRSSEEITTLSRERKPDWSYERLFLNVLVYGNASLYQYRHQNSVRYFYSVSNSPIQQLIYKEYYTKENSVAYNNDFRQQLWMDVRRPETIIKSIESINYTQKELERYFKEYNGIEYQGTEVFSKKRDILVIKAKAGIDYSSVTVRQSFYGPEFKNSCQNYNYMLGMEADIILPFNKNKWGLIIDPSYQYFNKNMSEMSVDFKSIEFPIGIRYNFFLRDNLKVYLNGFYIPVLKFDFNSTVDISFGITKYHLDVNHGAGYTIGAGIDYKKISLELRFYPKSDLLNHYLNASADYHRLSFIVGYTLFKINQK